MTSIDDSRRSLRLSVYLLLVAVGIGGVLGRLLAVDSVDKIDSEKNRISAAVAKERTTLEQQGVSGDALNAQLRTVREKLEQELALQRPFLSANDRSRWATVRALVEQGTYAIDDIVAERGWDTIDMVKHRGRDGQDHLYSSKPPLFATLMAGEYWLIHRLTGATLASHPYEIGRAMLVTWNVLPLVAYFVLLAWLAERFGTSD